MTRALNTIDSDFSELDCTELDFALFNNVKVSTSFVFIIVASFLIKNLHIDWRLGEKYFAQNLVDYDVFVNQGNWQWVAGSGADSQPYFRVFNPSLQSYNYDKLALYIKKWLPQLSDIPPNDLHNWSTEYVKYDLHKIKYNKPIVDYIKSKEEGILMYKKIF